MQNKNGSDPSRSNPFLDFLRSYFHRLVRTLIISRQFFFADQPYLGLPLGSAVDNQLSWCRSRSNVAAGDMTYQAARPPLTPFQDCLANPIMIVVGRNLVSNRPQLRYRVAHLHPNSSCFYHSQIILLITNCHRCSRLNL